MFVELADTFYVVRALHDPTTGDMVNADSTPVVKWYEDGAAGSTTGVTITETFDSVSGLVKVAIVCSGANGFELGKRYSVVLYATIGGVDQGAEIANFQIVATQNVAGYPMADAAAISGDTTAADNLEAWLDGSATGLLPGTTLIRRNTCQSGSTSSTVKFDTSANATNDKYNGACVWIVSGTGVDQSPRLMTDYVGATKVANVSPNWLTTPDNTSVFEIRGQSPVDVEMFGALLADIQSNSGFGYPSSSVIMWSGDFVADGVNWDTNGVLVPASGMIGAQNTAVSGGASTITIGGFGESFNPTTDDLWKGARIVTTGGTGKNQERVITAYNATTHVITVDRPWAVNPDSSTTYIVIAGGRNELDQIADAIFDEATAGHTTAGTFGKLLADIYAAIDTEIASILAAVDTEIADIQARLPAALTANGNMKADALRWNGLVTVDLPIAPTTAGRKVTVTATGAASLNWGDIENKTTTNNLSGTTIKDVTDVETAIAALDVEIDALSSGVNVTSISGDSGAADALEAMLDGTGLVGPNFPARQQDVRNIAATSAAINIVAVSAIVTKGIETNDFSDTETDNGTSWEIGPEDGEIDVSVDFDLGDVPRAVATLVSVAGLHTAIETIKVEAWDGAAWDQIGEIVGIATATEEGFEFELTNSHTFSETARVRFSGTGLTGTLKIDRLLVGVAAVPPTAAEIGAEVDVGTVDANVVSFADDAISDDAISSAAVDKIGLGVWAQSGEGSHTYGDLIRGTISAVVGPVTGFLTGILPFKSLNSAKTRWTIVTDDDGRQEVTAGDLTN